MRLFVSLPLANDVRAALADLQARLREAAPNASVRWVSSENLHLTVRFLGDLGDVLLPDVEGICEEAALTTPAFRLGVCGASFFPKRGPLKTLWVGLSHGADDWKALVQRLDAPFSALRVPRENGLIPHITLGRVLNSESDDRLRNALLAEKTTNCGGQVADRLELVQSFLNPAGAVHTTLHAWSFINKEQ